MDLKNFNKRTKQLEREQKLVDLTMTIFMIIVVTAIIMAPFYV